MGTIDSNGIYFYEDTDAVSPLHTLLNVGQQSVTDAFDTLPSAEYAVNVVSASNGSFSGTFPAGLFTTSPILQCSVQSNTQFVFASGAATSTTAFSGYCAYFPALGGIATTAGFTITVRATQM